MPQKLEDFIKDIPGNESFKCDKAMQGFYEIQEKNTLSVIQSTLETTNKYLSETSDEEFKKKFKIRIAILEKLIAEKEKAPIQEAPQKVMQNNVESLQTLYKRIYGDAEGEAQFVFKDDNQKYLTHALIQSVLYNIEQQCVILFVEEHCLNDGTNAMPMSIDSFKVWVNTKQTNPETREPIQPETYNFYDCVTRTNTFNKPSFAAYKTQYERAQLMLMESPLEGIPKEVSDFIEKGNIKIAFQIQNLKNAITNASSAQEIRQLLENLSQNSNATSPEIQKFQKAIEALLEAEKFKKKFDEAKLGCFEQFKNFVLKCVYTIFYYIQWFLFSEKATDRNAKISRGYKEIDNSTKAFKDFKDFVCTEIDNPQVIEIN